MLLEKDMNSAFKIIVKRESRMTPTITQAGGCGDNDPYKEHGLLISWNLKYLWDVFMLKNYWKVKVIDEE